MTLLCRKAKVVIKDADRTKRTRTSVGASAKLIDGDLEDDPVAQEMTYATTTKPVLKLPESV
jgi:hypothetical protein